MIPIVATQALDELICSQLFSKLFLKLDQMDNDAVPSYFTENAVWERQDKTLQGRTEILQEMKNRPAQMFVQHIAHQLVCEDVQRDRIKASVYMTVFRHVGSVVPPLPARAPDMLLLWNVEFTRAGDTWHISRLAAKSLYRD